MPIYHQLGELPRKRHAEYLKADGTLHTEELVGGAGASSLLYHLHAPTRVLSTRQAFELVWTKQRPRPLAQRHFRTHRMAAADRVPLLFNSDVALLTWTPHRSGYYRNAQADELLYVAEGGGVVASQMGELAYREGDLVVIPRGIVYTLRMNPVRHRLLVVESRGAVRIPGRYRSEQGQMLAGSPYCERDIRRPATLPVHDERGQFSVVVKKDNWLQELVLDHHPLDVVGWDGHYYPWALNVAELEAGAGALLLAGTGFTLGTLGKRPHVELSGVSDAAVYSAQAAAGAGLEFGSLTLHPAGMAYGPQEGGGLRLLVKTEEPLEVGEGVLTVEDPEYASAAKR